ncbi:hypothetical protein [Haloarchaeobius iranensis]
MEELDEHIQELQADNFEVQAEVRDLSGDVLNRYTEILVNGYEQENFKIIESEFSSVESQKLEAPPDAAISGGSTSTTLSAPQRLLFTGKALSILAEELIASEGTRFMITILVANVIFPLIAQDTTIDSYEKILARVYWSLLVLHFVTNSSADS